MLISQWHPASTTVSSSLDSTRGCNREGQAFDEAPEVVRRIKGNRPIRCRISVNRAGFPHREALDSLGIRAAQLASTRHRLMRSLGGCGIGPGEFSTPHGIDLLRDGRVLVGDRENDRVQVFSPDGIYLTEWRGFYHPMDIFVGVDEHIYVSDQRPRVTAVNESGEIVGSCKPALSVPHGITGDHEGTIFIIESRNISDITKLEPCEENPAD